MKKMEYLPCPTNSKELKNFVLEKFSKGIWAKEFGRKKKYYVDEFNPTCDLQQKEYIGASIQWRATYLNKLGKKGCLHFALLGQWNQKSTST